MAVGNRKSGKVIALDGDKLGHILGAMVALGVVLVQLFLLDADFITVLTRAGWTFVGVYAATFFWVRIILRHTIRQVVEEKRHKREERLQRQREARQKAEELGLALPEAVPVEAVVEEQPQ